MANTLGKRKRDATKLEAAPKPAKQPARSASPEDDLQAIFKRHFEARFKPLAIAPLQTNSRDSEDEVDGSEDEDESDWEGISEDEGPSVQVVDYTAEAPSVIISKQEKKAFMSSKPPSASSTTIQLKAPAPEDTEGSEALNLKNDLALQRLLQESHLLDGAGGDSFNPTGKNRHKATDMRIQALGAKKSLAVQEKMPMSHRKGITAKTAEREDKRRTQARENGIVLEKAVKVKKGPPKMRERGVGGPVVGRFRGGTLMLSQKDVASIQGPKRSAGGKAKGKKRG